MKRAGLFVVIATIILLMVVGAHSEQEERTKQKEQEQMQLIEKELDQLTHRAQQLAEQIKLATAMMQPSK